MSDYRVNGMIEPEQTQFKIPEGTVIIENQESYEEAPAGGVLLPRDPVIPEITAEPVEHPEP